MDVRETIVVSANLGGFDKTVPATGTITDDLYPPRLGSMTPRLQARIVKTHMWQFYPDYDYYIWVDSSCQLKPGAEKWFKEKLSGGDIAVFRHPHRKTIQEEADYLKHRLAINCPYITPRYAGEDIDGQLAQVDPQQELYASTAFIYRNSAKVRGAMKEWWYHISRYHSIDQLSLPFVLFEAGLDTRVIEENYLKCEALEYVRNK